MKNKFCLPLWMSMTILAGFGAGTGFVNISGCIILIYLFRRSVSWSAVKCHWFPSRKVLNSINPGFFPFVTLLIKWFWSGYVKVNHGSGCRYIRRKNIRKVGGGLLTTDNSTQQPVFLFLPVFLSAVYPAGVRKKICTCSAEQQFC